MVRWDAVQKVYEEVCEASGVGWLAWFGRRLWRGFGEVVWMVVNAASVGELIGWGQTRSKSTRLLTCAFN